MTASPASAAARPSTATARRCSKPSSSIFDGDLYGETCAVSFFGFLRGEVKFDGLDALVAQMRQDEAEARALLAGVRPLSALDARIAFTG